MRKICILYLLLFWVQAAKADHITGGEMYYSFSGESGGQYRYSVTLKLFMVCNSPRDFNNPTYVSFFNKGTNARVRDVMVNLTRTEIISLTLDGTCITNPPTICYRVGYYIFDVLLPSSSEGYLLSSQVIYRVDGMKNLVVGYDQLGASYTAEIPGTAASDCGPENNSAKFSGDDLVVICADNELSYSFAAYDADGDQLTYSFCNAYRESTGGFGQDATPPGAPPYNSVPYGQGYSGSLPLGGNVTIDPSTGVLTGIAPAEGTYVITVCVAETRNNTVIATQRKDIQVTITSCSIAAAALLPQYTLCADTKTINISNLSTSPLIKTYNWQFVNAGGATIFSTAQQQASYTFTDTGLYSIRLVINKGDACADSASTIVKVYPGFEPGFGFDGVCINKPTQFTDSSISVYGTVDKWQWDFDGNTANDFSALQNPAYTYPAGGTKNVRLIVSDSKGCVDTVFQAISIIEKPPLTLAFRDTLICLNDSVRLLAAGMGVFTWFPNLFMTGANTASPGVSPTATTTYYVELNDNGCLNNDSVMVNVVDRVTLQVMNDTTICSGDTIMLRVISDGLKYAWTPAARLTDDTEKTPLAITDTTTTYEVLAIIGSCSAKEDITVSSVPYPVAFAGADTTICYQTAAQLKGVTDGRSFVWSPSSTLMNANTLNPAAYPVATTTYMLSAYDIKGCPKSGTDVMTVTVLPEIKASAGRDTAVVTGQALQMNASGGTRYQWSPGTGLSSTTIANPVALYNSPAEGIRYRVLVYNEAGCADSAFITVKIFKTLPSVFVPTAFTPNGDGRNDVLRPIAAGIERIDFFNIYNRWGQLVFSTSVNGMGWNGATGGLQNASGVYVWMVKARDYTGALYMQQGTVTLIR